MANIIIINGSLNNNSKTKQVLQLIEHGLRSKNYSTTLLNIGDLDLPIFNPNIQNKSLIESILFNLNEASAFVIGSPEYHGGYSGALKNFIDYLDSDIFRNKPIALVATSGGMKAGINTLNGLRLVFRSLHADVIPQQIAICEKEIVDGKFSKPCLQSISQLIYGIENKVDSKIS